MHNLLHYKNNYNKIRTSLGGVIDASIQFMGYDTTHEIAPRFSQTEALLLWLLGRKPSEIETRIIDMLVTINTYPDIRIWSIRAGAFAAAKGAPLATAFGVSQAASNGKIFGVQTAKKTVSFLNTVRKKLPDKSLSQIIEELKQNGYIFPGYGRPVIQGPDERVLKIHSLMKEYGHQQGVYGKLQKGIAQVIQKKYKLYPNFSAVFVPLLMDKPFYLQADKIESFCFYLNQLSSLASIEEISASTSAKPLLPLKISDVEYTGKNKRSLER